jgi:hypothetical protein
MGFASGAISFRRYAVIGQSPEAIDESVLERLAEHALRERDDRRADRAALELRPRERGDSNVLTLLEPPAELL